MRIAVDARPLAHPHTGIGRYTAAILMRLFELKPGNKWFLYSDRPLDERWQSRENVVVREGRAQGAVMRLWCSQVLFSRWARRDRVDVFWSPRHHLPLLLGSDIRCVLTIHDMVWQRFPETMLKANLRAEKLLMPPSLKRADAVVAVSQFTADEVAAFFPDCAGRISVVREAGFGGEVDVEAGTSISGADPADVFNSGPAFFLFVGTLEPRKNLSGLLRAIAELVHQRAHDIRLIVVGGQGWGNQHVTSWVRELKLGNVVTQLGTLDRSDLQHAYSQAIALVMPSWYEGFGLPVAEAMECGTPVIAGDRGALPEVVGAAGLLIDPDEEMALADAMESLLVDRELRDRLAVAAEQRSQEFSWDRAAKETLAILEGEQTKPISMAAPRDDGSEQPL